MGKCRSIRFSANSKRWRVNMSFTQCFTLELDRLERFQPETSALSGWSISWFVLVGSDLIDKNLVNPDIRKELMVLSFINFIFK